MPGQSGDPPTSLDAAELTRALRTTACRPGCFSCGVTARQSSSSPLSSGRAPRRPRATAHRTSRSSQPRASAVRALTDGSVEFADSSPMPVVTQDPKDDYLVVLAQTAEAFALVSGDRHVLELDIRPPVLTPRELLELV